MTDIVTHYVGLDVHKDTIAIAYAKANQRTKPVFIGTTEYSPGKIKRAVSKLGKPDQLKICYEAGPCGYGLARELQKLSFDCQVIAPSKVARQPGDKVKTDRKDALLLARLHRAGELTPVTVPDLRDEAIRDLVRAREDAVVARRRAQQQLQAFLLRQGKRYTGGATWTKRYRLYLSRLMMDDPISHAVFAECRLAVSAASDRVERAEQSLKDHVVEWRWYPTVQALMTMRGIGFIAATTIMAEIGDFRRFPAAPALMAYLGLVPSEFSSGSRQVRGSITKAGNRYVRRILVEAAWNYRFPARIGESMTPRHEGQPQEIISLSWKAQLRLCPRYRRMKARGLHQNKVCTAIARELIAFCWDIARRIEPDS